MKLLELTNNTLQTVAAGEPLILGNISRRVGCFTDYSSPGTIITLRDAGYYDITIKTNAEATAATQELQITVYLDGVAIPETLSTHVGAAIGDVETLNTNKIIRVFNCSSNSISIVNTGTADTTYSGLVVDIVKVV